jgi:E3 ubiquitin-protein ligase SIAH1
MASLSLEDGRSIVNLLECPVCLGTMRPPIFQCRNGHSVCGEWKQRVAKCPTCREASIDTRNLLAEDLAYKVKYPCKNTVRGCYVKKHLEDMKKDESVCRHRMYHCLVGKEDGCTWTGPRLDILPHTEDKHGEYVYRSGSCSFKVENNDYLKKLKLHTYFLNIGIHFVQIYT